MSTNFKLAMPVGSKWRAYNHLRKLDMGEREVIAHRSTFIELKVTESGVISRMTYPLANSWKMDRDHIRIGNEATGLVLTYGPA
jgi:hypothetical protein